MGRARWRLMQRIESPVKHKLLVQHQMSHLLLGVKMNSDAEVETHLNIPTENLGRKLNTTSSPSLVYRDVNQFGSWPLFHLGCLDSTIIYVLG